MSAHQSTLNYPGHGETFGRKLTDHILRGAQGYVHRPRRNSPPATGSEKSRAIQARIAANAQKRYQIAEAMKREAGVASHDLTGELKGGIAWTDRSHILAPAGENRVQLATLAHECGHVFLHSIGSPGNDLPTHVQEMEAESYAHQAFAAHGMRMPKEITRWGRAYVGQWIVADRADGIPIDPRAEAYAWGNRSPYEPLRIVPKSWNNAPAESVRAKPPIVSGSVPTGFRWHWHQFKRDAAEMARFTILQFVWGWALSHIFYAYFKLNRLLPADWRTGKYTPTADEMILFLTAAACWTLLMLLVRTATIAPRRRSTP